MQIPPSAWWDLQLTHLLIKKVPHRMKQFPPRRRKSGSRYRVIHQQSVESLTVKALELVYT